MVQDLGLPAHWVWHFTAQAEACVRAKRDECCCRDKNGCNSQSWKIRDENEQGVGYHMPRLIFFDKNTKNKKLLLGGFMYTAVKKLLQVIYVGILYCKNDSNLLLGLVQCCTGV